jgi:motility quorum-sensing regulator / GCU-specific mRNA interferase toxin
MANLVVSGAGEKRKPHHVLASFKAVFAKDRSIVETARRDALKMGMTIDDVASAIKVLTAQHFYKSMSSHRNRSQWQDVYHLPYDGKVIYVKFTDDAVTAFTLLSFKEK